MLRGYRVALIVAGGLALAAADKPPEKAQDANREEQRPAPSALTYAPYPDLNSDACYNAKDHDAADLCAQWRAAFGSEKAAREAERATDWAIIATILSGLAVAGLLYTIWQTHGSLGEARRANILAQRSNARATRQAVASAKDTAIALSHAGRSANAAQRQADIAAQESEARTRAYVYIKEIGVGFVKGRAKRQIKVLLSNFGHTPAYNVVLQYCAVVAQWPHTDEVDLQELRNPRKLAVIPQGEPATILIDMAGLSDDLEKMLGAGAAAVYLRVSGTYEYRPRPRESVTTGFGGDFVALPDDIAAGVFRIRP